jgi:hypothetical protein
MLGFFGRRPIGCSSLLVTAVVAWLIWAALVRPFLIEVSNYYWWMRP